MNFSFDIENAFLILTILMVLIISMVVFFKTSYYNNLKSCIFDKETGEVCRYVIETSLGLAIVFGAMYLLVPATTAGELFVRDEE